MSRSDSLDRVITSDPINRVARRVVQPGTHYDNPVQLNQAHWENAPPTTGRFPGTPDGDLTGTKFGRMEVVGYLASGKNKGAIWLVRCSCGDYETRRSSAIRNGSNSIDCCNKCRHIQHLKRQRYWLSTGHQMPEDMRG